MNPIEFEDGTLVFVSAALPAPRETGPRWRVVITYKTLVASFDKVVLIEELDELHDIVESGPDFYAIDGIHIELANQLAQPVEVLN